MIGKVNDDLFQRAILPHTGAQRPEVAVGPQMGVDAAVLKVGDQFMVVAEDPVFPGPTTSPEAFGWLTVHIGASDVAVMGVAPQFMTYSLLLPPETSEEYLRRLVKSISDTARELGIAIVGGHTGYYGAVTVPTIGGITVWGMASEVITAGGARPGDAVIITKGAGIEAAALLAAELGQRCREAGVPEALVARAAKRMQEITVVADARTATAVGGVHAMHDATEGGLARGLWEVAQASGVGLRIDRSRVPVPADIEVVCAAFGLNPYEVISEGTLVLACEPKVATPLLATFHAMGIEAAEIGLVVPESEGHLWELGDGETEPIVPPPVDKFWEVFFGALSSLAGARPEEGESTAERAVCADLAQAVARLEAANVVNLIPEIGAGFAYAMPGAKRLEEVAAIPGRLLACEGRVGHLGEPAMGVSVHMGGSLLEVRSFFPAARCVMNLRNNARVREALAGLGLVVAEMPAIADFRQTHEDYVRDLRATLAGCARLPDVITIPDRINLERLILVLGESPAELVGKVIRISERVRELG